MLTDRFHSDYCSPSLAISENGRVATRKNHPNVHHTVLVNSPINLDESITIEFRIIFSVAAVMIGVTDSPFLMQGHPGHTNDFTGFAVHGPDGVLYGHNGQALEAAKSTPFTQPFVTGDRIAIRIHQKQVTFFKNRNLMNTKFPLYCSSLTRKIYVSLSLHTSGDQVEITRFRGDQV